MNLNRRSIQALTILAIFCASASAPAQQFKEDPLHKAQELLAHHQAEAASALLRPYVAQHPEDAVALTLLAQSVLDAAADSGSNARANEDAAHLLSAALAADPRSIPANLAAGKLLLSDHKDPEAMDRFETVLASDLHNPDARSGELGAAMDLAVSARGAGHPEIALQVLEHATAKLPDEPRLLLTLGMEATELGHFTEAETSLHEAAKLAPHDADTVYALARLEFEQQHMQVAESEFRAYLVMRPNDASAHFGLGHALAMMQRVEEARTEFETSIRLQPAQTESYYQIGELELDAQQDAKARALFEKVLIRDPKHAGALTGIGVLSFRQKLYAQAEQSLAAAEASAPDFAAAHYYRGLALARMGRKTESDDELRTAAKLGHASAAPAN